MSNQLNATVQEIVEFSNVVEFCNGSVVKFSNVVEYNNASIAEFNNGQIKKPIGFY